MPKAGFQPGSASLRIGVNHINHLDHLTTTAGFLCLLYLLLFLRLIRAVDCSFFDLWIEKFVWAFGNTKTPIDILFSQWKGREKNVNWVHFSSLADRSKWKKFVYIIQQKWWGKWQKSSNQPVRFTPNPMGPSLGLFATQNTKIRFQQTEYVLCSELCANIAI